MKKQTKSVTRRDFIKGAGAAAIGVAAIGLPAFTEDSQPALSRVVLVRNKKVVNDVSDYNGGIVQEMASRIACGCPDISSTASAPLPVISLTASSSETSDGSIR